MSEAGCLGQKIPGKSLRSLRGEKVPEVLRLQNFSPTGQKTDSENFRDPRKGSARANCLMSRSILLSEVLSFVT